MSRKRKCLRRALLALAGVLYATAALPAAKAPQAAEGGPLAMEALEVRGVREKPEQLYVPAPKRLFHYAPVRYDLFTEDLAEPIPPSEVRDDRPINGGTR